MTAVLQRSLSITSPLAIAGTGAFLRLDDGTEILDACGGAAVACIGHGHRRVAEAVSRQMRLLSYAHTGFFTSAPAESLAEILVGHRPGGMSRALFLSSGSEAVDAAVKLARQYFVESGQGERSHIIARRQSYHGGTLGSLSIGGHRARRAPYLPLLSPWVSHVVPCFAFHHRLPNEDDATYVARLAHELEAEFQRIGPGKVLAFCAETVVGATTGCVSAVPGYFRAVRRVCDRHGALLILDEIMCGMGRTGRLHAWELEGVVPDIQIIGKGLGGGYQPIGAVLVSERIVQALSAGSRGFMHGQTYQGHPVACAAAYEVQRIIAEEGLVAAADRNGAVFLGHLMHELGAHPHVGDIRGRGLFVGIEFLQDRATKRAFPAASVMADRVRQAAFDHGLLVYPGTGTVDGEVGDHVLFAPPLNSAPDQLELIVERFLRALAAVFG